MIDFILKVDNSVFDSVNRIHNQFILSISSILDLGFDLTVIFIISILICSYLFVTKKWKTLLLYVLTLGGGSILGYIIKHAINRERPTLGIIPLEGYSFPSGHALSATLFCGFIIYVLYRSNISALPKLLLTFFLSLLIIAVSLSRVFLGVHWFSDILGGVTIGLFWLIISATLTNLLINNSLKKQENSILS